MRKILFTMFWLGFLGVSWLNAAAFWSWVSTQAPEAPEWMEPKSQAMTPVSDSESETEVYFLRFNEQEEQRKAA